MFNDFMKKLTRYLLIGIVWVFILSIKVDGRTLFSYSNETLVQNRFVTMVDEELADLWYKVKETARVTYENMTGKEEKRG